MAVIEMHGRNAILVHPCRHLWIRFYTRPLRKAFGKQIHAQCIDCELRELYDPERHRG